MIIVAPEPLLVSDTSYPTNDRTDFIEILRQTLVGTINRGEASAWAALYSDDALHMPPNAPANRGRDSIRAWARRLLTTAQMHLSLAPEGFEASEDVVAENGSYSSTVEIRQTGEVIQDHGKYLTVYRRAGNAQWAVTRDIWNSDKPDLAFRRDATWTSTPSQRRR